MLPLGWNLLETKSPGRGVGTDKWASSLMEALLLSGPYSGYTTPYDGSLPAPAQGWSTLSHGLIPGPSEGCSLGTKGTNVALAPKIQDISQRTCVGGFGFPEASGRWGSFGPVLLEV